MKVQICRAPVMASLLAVALLVAPARPQGTAEDYARAEALAEAWPGLLREFRPAFRWSDGDLWWRRDTSRGPEYVRVDGETGERRVSTDAALLGLRPTEDLLAPQATWGPSRGGGAATRVTFRNALDRRVRLFWAQPGGELRAYGELEPGAERVQSTYAGHVWVTDFSADDLTGIFVAEAWSGIARIDDASRSVARGAPPEPPAGESTATLELRDHDVWGVAPGGEVFRLTTDGTAEDPYLDRFHPSPDGRTVLGFRQTAVERRRIPLIDSAPDERVQPGLEWIDYAKPGDALPQRRPRLFDLERRRSVPVDDGPFADSWSVRFERWSADGARAYVLYNRRGHQQLTLRAIDAATGAVTDVVDERSATFVDYSQKTQLHWLDGTGELLWASERDGWNHLYRVDASTGAVVAQVTSGEWVVRDVERVDEAAGQVWFTAMGIRPDQDPYHRHLARANLDGSGLTILTEGDGTHEWTFSDDGELFVDRWSRVDSPATTELRRATDGSFVARLGEDDVRELVAADFMPPQRFTAKGRDGETDIWGHIIRPSNFDPGRRYPVIEAIYAGPHDHHVPKRFGLQLRERRLAELGFIVVQIDGMGTNWRSKAFHDVAWRDLADGGFPDRIAWLRAAAAEHPELDLTRVGIYGGSAGGQNALAALLHHGDFYRAAAADCGCHDNRMDKIWWNEAWMGVVGPHYAASSNVTHAAKLTGDLLLTVGELDRNVDPASTLQVVDALIRADRDFEFVLVPGAGHGVGESPYLFRRRQDFFVRSLLGVEPRD